MIGILNYLLFYLGWFICLYGASIGEPWMGFLSAWIIVPLFIALSKHKIALIITLFATLILGFSIDTFFAYFGFIQYESNLSFFQYGAPFWVLSLYAIFATSVDSSLKTLQYNLLLSGIIGFFAGPLSYRAAAAMGAITILKPYYIVLLIAGCIWFFFIPTILTIFRYSKLFIKRHY